MMCELSGAESVLWRLPREGDPGPESGRTSKNFLFVEGA